MNLLQRLRNLWKVSGDPSLFTTEMTFKNSKLIDDAERMSMPSFTLPADKMAQICKRKPVDDIDPILKDNQDKDED